MPPSAEAAEPPRLGECRLSVNMEWVLTASCNACAEFLAPLADLVARIHLPTHVPHSTNTNTTNRTSSSGGDSPAADEGEGVGDELTAEFSQVSDPGRFRELARRLDLLWKMSDAAKAGAKPERCADCRGTGELECRFCAGTGSMTVGDTLYCSETGCSPCPVCGATGDVRCGSCSGTGFRASWLEPPPAASSSSSQGG